MSGAKIIIGKELTRVFKDKKLVFSLFILPAIIMIGMYSLLGTLVSNVNNDVVEHISSVYIQNAPEGLEDVMKSSGFAAGANINYISDNDSLDNHKEDILNGNIDLLISFEDGFLDKVRNYKNAGDTIPQITLYYNTTVNYSSVARSKFVEMVMTGYQTQLLTERFGNLEQLTVFTTAEEIIADEDKENGQFMSMMIPYLITFLLFTGAMSLGVDAITGEKERGTMASMLLSPISRGQIVAGKIISLAILSSLSAIVYSVSMIIAMPMMMEGMGEAARVNFNFTEMLQLLAIMLVMVYLYVAVVVLFAALARTAKEATTYVSPVYIVVIVAGILTMFTGGKEKALFQYAIPVYGNALSIQNLILKELTMPQFLLSIGGTGLLALICTVVITKAFNSEKVMFNA